MVSPSATSPGLTDLNDNGYFFRTAPSDARGGQILADITNGCAIVTKQAEESIKHIHHRMPLILDKNDESAWLAGKDHIASNASMNIKFHPVSKMVNSPSNNSDNCIKELSA